MIIEDIEELYNKLYEFAVTKRFANQLINAKKVFVINEEQNDTEGFAEWFIFNYRLMPGNNKIVDIFQETEMLEELRAIKKSFRSIFEVREERELIYLKDIFTNTDYVLSHNLYTKGELISARIVRNNQENFVIGDVYELDSVYKDNLKKYILEQYNLYSIQAGTIPLDQFLDFQGHLIYKVKSIVESVIEENLLNEELILHQALYAFNIGQDLIIEKLQQLDFPLIDDDEDEPIFRIMQEDVIICEIEITNGMLYILCNNDAHLKMMLEMMNRIVNENLVFVKTETFTLEELLSK